MPDPDDATEARPVMLTREEAALLVWVCADSADAAETERDFVEENGPPSRVERARSIAVDAARALAIARRLEAATTGDAP